MVILNIFSTICVASIITTSLLFATPADGQDRLATDDQFDLYQYLRNSGEYEEAKKVGDRLLSDRTALFGRESIEVLEILAELSFHYQVMGLADQAEPLSREALMIGEKLLLSHDPLMFQIIADLISAKQMQQDDWLSSTDQEIEKLELQSIELSKELFELNSGISI